MDPETKPEAHAGEAQAAPAKRERSASPSTARPEKSSQPQSGDNEINEEDAMNDGDANPSKKPKFEKKNKKDFKPKSPYPGRGKNRDRPQLTDEERRIKTEERERLRVERRIADEERLENRDEADRRLPKRRCALLLGYCGSGYSGMQIQNDVETIEGEMFKALVKAGAVSEDNSIDHRKVDVQRAARTDAGVHAAGNVISLKMILDPPLPAEHPTLASYVNSFLPDQIRMWGWVRTIKSFQARTTCDSRVYEYLLPTYCLLPPASDDALAKHLDISSPGWREGMGEAAAFADAWVPEEESPEDAKPETGDIKPESTEVKAEGTEETPKVAPKKAGEFERRRGWRCDQGTLARFRELINEYVGTHNFHNYTIGKPFNDRSVKRFMITIDVSEPTLYGDIEWISVKIHGQSFMLHQIRKMMSLAMLACRTNTPKSLIAETYGPKRIHIPKAPPLGLLLESPQFRTYNNRIESNIYGGPDDRDKVEFTPYADQMQEFKVKHIYEKLREDELKTHVFHKWIRQTDTTPDSQLSFLNSKGTIPPEAQIANIKKMEKEALEAGKPDEGTKREEGMDSDDEELDQRQLNNGELEG